jgi:hypothetical protein
MAYFRLLPGVIERLKIHVSAMTKPAAPAVCARAAKSGQPMTALVTPVKNCHSASQISQWEYRLKLGTLLLAEALDSSQAL